MDITSPITLWKDYDIAALPLNESCLSPKSENGATVKEYYFDGFITVDGRTRTYIKFFENSAPKGTIIYLPNASGVADGAVAYLYDQGYTVGVLDYLGTGDDGSRYTLYPPSLAGCNRRNAKSFNISDTEQISHWFVWTCIARRAVELAKHLYPSAPIFALGVGLGGTTAYKLAAFDDGLTACATLLNIIPNVEGSGNSIINYRASLDSSAYATISKVPLFMAISSNDGDGSLDSMAELANNTQSLKRFRIIERALSDGINAAYDDLDKFFTACCAGSTDLPKPQITASNSEGNLYFNISIPCDDEAAELSQSKTELFVSFCIEEAPNRNWMNIPLISLGGNKFMASAKVCNDTRPIYAFANLTFEDGTTQSSSLLGVIPKSIGIHAFKGVSHRKLYDGSMGRDGWTTRNGGKIRLVQGPYNIDGVTSETHSLITFKPGDPLFKVTPDILLQIMVCGKSQAITVSVTDKTATYYYRTFIGNTENWNKLSLSHMNFKSSVGTLLDWNNIYMLEISGEDDFIVGSVIWV